MHHNVPAKYTTPCGIVYIHGRKISRKEHDVPAEPGRIYPCLVDRFVPLILWTGICRNGL